MSLNPPQPDPEQIAAAAFLLRLSARPLIVAGAGVIASRAEGELMQIAELVGSPVITTAGAGGAFPQDHPLAAGIRLDQPESAALIAESDMIMAVGTSFSSLPPDRLPDLPAQMIHIDTDPAQINRVYPVRNAIVGDARPALQQMIAQIQAAAPIAALAASRAAGAPVRAARARRACPGEGA